MIRGISFRYKVLYLGCASGLLTFHGMTVDFNTLIKTLILYKMKFTKNKIVLNISIYVAVYVCSGKLLCTLGVP